MSLPLHTTVAPVGQSHICGDQHVQWLKSLAWLHHELPPKNSELVALLQAAPCASHHTHDSIRRHCVLNLASNTKRRLADKQRVRDQITTGSVHRPKPPPRKVLLQAVTHAVSGRAHNPCVKRHPLLLCVWWWRRWVRWEWRRRVTNLTNEVINPLLLLNGGRG